MEGTNATEAGYIRFWRIWPASMLLMVEAVIAFPCRRMNRTVPTRC